MADINRPIRVRNYTLRELEQIAKDHSANLGKYINGYRVDLELFIESEFT